MNPGDTYSTKMGGVWYFVKITEMDDDPDFVYGVLTQVENQKRFFNSNSAPRRLATMCLESVEDLPEGLRDRLAADNLMT